MITPNTGDQETSTINPPDTELSIENNSHNVDDSSPNVNNYTISPIVEKNFDKQQHSFNEQQLPTENNAESITDTIYYNVGKESNKNCQDIGFTIAFIVHGVLLYAILTYYIVLYYYEDVKIYKMSFEMDLDILFLACASLLTGLLFGLLWLYLLRKYINYTIRLSLAISIGLYLFSIIIFFFQGYFWSTLLMCFGGVIMCLFFYSSYSNVLLYERLIKLCLHSAKPYIYDIFVTSVWFSIITAIFILYWFYGSLALISTIYQHHYNRVHNTSTHTATPTNSILTQQSFLSYLPSFRTNLISSSQSLLNTDISDSTTIQDDTLVSSLPYIVLWCILILSICFIIETIYNLIHVVISGALASWWLQSSPHDLNVVSDSLQIAIQTSIDSSSTFTPTPASSFSLPLPPIGHTDRLGSNENIDETDDVNANETVINDEEDDNDTNVLYTSSSSSASSLSATNTPVNSSSSSSSFYDVESPHIAFSRSKDILSPAVFRGTVYNLGTIVFGSIFSGFIHFLHYIIAFVSALTKISFFKWCLPFSNRLIEMCKEFIAICNIYTFSMVALTNEPLLKSARMTSNLLNSNHLEQLPLHQFCQMVISLGSLTSSIVCCLVGGWLYCIILDNSAEVMPFFVASICGYITTGLVLQPIMSAVVTSILIHCVDPTRIKLILSDDESFNEWIDIIEMLEAQSSTSLPESYDHDHDNSENDEDAQNNGSTINELEMDSNNKNNSSKPRVTFSNMDTII